MSKRLVSALLGAIVIGFGTSSTVQPMHTVLKSNEITYNSENENVTNVHWHNNLYSLDKDEESKDLFQEYSVDTEEVERSTDVFIQEEEVYFDEIVPTSLSEEANHEANLSDVESCQESEFTHNKGYIKFITKAYVLGFFDGHIVYHIEVTTEQQKSFRINKNDNLFLQHGDNAMSFVLDEYPYKGERFTPCTICYAYDPKPITADETEQLEPNWSSGGVYYTFKAGGASVSDPYTSIYYGATTVTADYYILATGRTEVRPAYVHNRSLFVDSLPISFNDIGYGIQVGISGDVMKGQAMTLDGYDDDIKKTRYTLVPVDWGFDERYYFENEIDTDESFRYSTITKDGLTINTDRLRCGYEDEYINLSPNRYDAGEAYLELSFNKPIYVATTNLSFWSASEDLFASQGDSAYIQYLDVNNNWVTCLDMLDYGLSTDRTNQNHFVFDFIEGTYGIRYIATKVTPNTDIDKGRICIGETKFVTYNINN